MKGLIRSLLCFIALSSSAVYAQQATTNSIHLDQVGDSSVVTLTQKGSGNQMGSSTAPLTLNGNEQILTFTQEGNNNSLQGQILSSSVTSTINNVGNSNAIDLNMGAASSVSGTLFNLNLTGTSNEFSLTQGNVSASTGATLNYNLTGDWNLFNTTINTNGVTNTVDATGDHNTISTLQNGHDGKNIDFTLVGSGNIFTIMQKSLLNVDSLTINSIGNNGTFTISQCPPLGC